MLSVLFVGLVSALAVADPVAPAPSSTAIERANYLMLNAIDRRVRAPDPRVQALLAEGLHRSRTFAALMTGLSHGDVIVYVESVMTLPKETMGRLSMLPCRGDFRYVRVQIRAELSRREAIALIGHELQHALEIADAAEVRDQTGLIRLYERIGHQSMGEHAYDTEAARDTGRVVKREIASWVG